MSGFGLIHDGSIGTVVEGLHTNVFRFPGDTEADQEAFRHVFNDFVIAFDTGMAPSVGYHASFSSDSTAAKLESLHLVIEQSRAGKCDLTARAWVAGRLRGLLLGATGFESGLSTEPKLSLDGLRGKLTKHDSLVSFLCVPPGDGHRSALDRGSDGFLNEDERRAGSDPAQSDNQPTDF